VAPGDGLLRGHAVPEAVTRDHDEIVVGLAGHHFDIGASSHSLVLCLHRRIVFVFKIAESAGKGKHAVDATVLHKAVGVVDTLALDGVVRLVVLTEGQGLLVAGENCA